MGGAYAYGRTGVSVHYDGGVAKVRTRRKPRETWLALKPGAHDGYVEWERAEAIRAMISNNAMQGPSHGAPKHGAALLAGILRCQRYGRKMTIQYSGTRGQIPRYCCKRGQMDYGEPSCIGFGGLRVDDCQPACNVDPPRWVLADLSMLCPWPASLSDKRGGGQRVDKSVRGCESSLGRVGLG